MLHTCSSTSPREKIRLLELLVDEPFARVVAVAVLLLVLVPVLA